ncbi:phage portal protein [Loigolactobacillus bifermentans]|uniref:Phage portal protein, SPP1 Gp6-like n=1 Tax=Loigolactobacillus bifermentans DSM 20003 TaxID=1423726 RepID=A0A0R1HAY3_9LACO|nr:phage portal protein [Loigolactobacillus bifermentans]KRK40810.1 Phage portal protein, SPP1 Gp6-like [Loigolactobacillus bifermentans DSM 20003]QGG59562.1 phage portal protein [Loigolactobacillus bifermentans]
MVLEVNAPLLDDRFIEYARISNNGTFFYPAELEISTGDLLNLVDYHRDHYRKEYSKAYRYFTGDHTKLKKIPAKESYKPDNRLIVNFPKKAVTTFNGFFIGNPVKIDHKDKATDDVIEAWCNANSFDDVSAEVAKQASMYGRSYFFVYQDEDGHPCVTPLSPLNTFLIYDDTVGEHVKYGVTYRYNYEHKLEITLYSDKYQRTLIDATTAAYLDQSTVIANPYPIVPIIEAPENEERMALCEDIMSLIDALDKAMSEKANDVDYFADAYLKLIGAHMNPKDIKTMRDDRVINATGEGVGAVDIGFLAKPDADATQEHLVDRLVDYIYQIASVTNLNDDQFAGNPSGVSLKLKFQAMANMAQSKSLKFKKALRQVFECVFAISTGVSDTAWQELQFKFTQSVPENLTEDAQIVNQLYGKISNHTLFKLLPFIDDPDAELELIKKEQQENQNATAGLIQQALAAQTDQQKAGVTNADDNGGTGAKADKSTDKVGRQIEQAK